MAETVAALALAAAGTVALYRRCLQAGFMFDEPFDLPRGAGRSVTQVLTSAGDWQYYRPLPLLIWKVAYSVAGRYDPVLLHALVLGIHALNAWLVYLLGKQLGGRALGAIAAVLFLVFPFDYQTVLYVDGLYHALATAGVLAATLLYRRSRLAPGRVPARMLLGLALVCAAAGLLSYEDGVTVVVMVAAMEALLRLEARAKGAYLAPALFLLESVAFVVYRQAVPRWQPSGRLDGASLAQNALYFLQGVIDPVAGRLSAAPRLAGSPQATLLAAAAVTGVLLLVAIALRQRLRLAAFALVWCGAALLPAALALPWDYVQNAPRLLYLASAGIALLWAAALAPRWEATTGRPAKDGRTPAHPDGTRNSVGARHASPSIYIATRPQFFARTLGSDGKARAKHASPLPVKPHLGVQTEAAISVDADTVRTGGLGASHVRFAIDGMLALLLVGLISRQAIQFVGERLALQAHGATAVAQLAATATLPGPAGGRVYLNFPSWLAFKQQGYLYGSTGITMIPDYIGLGRSVYVQRGVEPSITSLAAPPQPPQWDDFVGLHGLPATPAALEQAFRQGGGVYRTRYAPGSLALQYLGRLDAGAPAPAGVRARFAGWAALAQVAARREGGQLAIELVWYARQPPPPNTTAFVLVSDAATGKALAEANGDPIGNMLALQRWRPGDRIDDCRQVILPPGAGTPRVQVWLANPATGLRVAAFDTQGARLAGDVVTLGVTVGAIRGAGC